MSAENKQNNAAPSSPTQSAALTKEDILRIAALPVKKMRVGNIVQDIICDEVTGYVYYPKPNPQGPYDALEKRRTRYNPEKVKEFILEQEKAEQEKEEQEKEELQKPFTPPEISNPFKKKAKKEKTKEENDSETKKKTEESDSAEKEKQKSDKAPRVVNRELKAEKKKEKKSSQSLKKRLAVLGCAATVVVLGLCIYPVAKEAIQQRHPDQPEPDPPVITEPVDENSASIVQVVNDLIPGDIITADDLREAAVNEETYNQLTLQGVNLYQWSRADALVGMYAQTYLPAGQYVSFSSIGASYEPPQSLWDSDSYIDIPLTAEQRTDADFLPGQKINVVLRKQVTQESPVTQEQNEVGQGGTSTTIVQTTTIEEISLPNTTICDVFTGEKKDQSLYQTLYALSTVPAGEQPNYINRAMQDESFADQFNQKILRIAVSQEDIEKIGKLDFAKTQISITPTTTFDKDDNDRASFAAAEQATMKNIQNAQAALQTEEET